MSQINSEHLPERLDITHPFFQIFETPISCKGPGVAVFRDNSVLSENVYKSIQNFKNHFKNIQIFDLGVMDMKDSIMINHSITLHNKNGVIPIFIGVDLELVGQIAAKIDSCIYQVANEITNLTNSTTYINSNFIGYQRHLCTLDDIYEIESNSYNSISLGKLRSFPQQLEPQLRDVELLHIDLNVVRTSDVPNVKNALPTGLNAEELCQLLKYAGNGNQIKAVFINANLKNNQEGIEESLLIAEAIWYFIEGYNINIKDHPAMNSDYSEFIIQSNSLDEELTFIKHNQSSRWWLYITDGQSVGKYIACSYEEYQASIGEEIPERIVKFINTLK